MNNFSDLGCCRHLKDRSSRYLGDAAIRWYRTRTLEELVADLGLTDGTAEVTIQGGIGTLIVRADRVDFTPAAGLAQIAAGIAGSAAGAFIGAVTGAAVLVDAADAERRLAICEKCPSWIPERGVCQACGCFTRAKARLASSQCPLGHWKSLPGKTQTLP